MSDISGIDLSALGLRSSEDLNPTEKQELGQEDFMELMIAQFQNQDPFNPMENGEFLGQLAQFSQVAGLQELQDSFAELSSSMVSGQALQASSLLGREVLVDSAGAGYLSSDGVIGGAIDLESSASNVKVQIKNSNGEVVAQFDLGQKESGLTYFEWDGLQSDGTQAPAGTYTIAAQAYDGSGGSEAATVLTEATVQSVTLGSADTPMTLTLLGIGDVEIADVRKIS